MRGGVFILCAPLFSRRSTASTPSIAKRQATPVTLLGRDQHASNGHGGARR